MAQQLFDGLQECMREDLRTIIRQELAIEDEKKVVTSITEKLWPVHELKATVNLSVGSSKQVIFDLIPGLTAGTNVKNSWVGLSFPKETYPSLHGDLTWHVTIHRKDGTARDKATVSGKFNSGRFFVNTDEIVLSWGTTFKTEDFDGISCITVEVHFKRNNDEKRTKWKTVEKHENNE